MVGRVGGEADPQEVLHTLQTTSLNGCEECTLTLGGSGSHVSCLRIHEVIAMDLTWLSSSVAMEPPVCSNRNWQFSVNPWRAAMCSPVVVYVSMRPTLIVHCISKIHVHIYMYFQSLSFQYTGVRSRGAGGAVVPPCYWKGPHTPSYCTSNRYCDTALAVVV